MEIYDIDLLNAFFFFFFLNLPLNSGRAVSTPQYASRFMSSTPSSSALDNYRRIKGENVGDVTKASDSLEMAFWGTKWTPSAGTGEKKRKEKDPYAQALSGSWLFNFAEALNTLSRFILILDIIAWLGEWALLLGC